MPQVVVVAGAGSGVGKTALGERLVALLASRGLRVAAVKHVHHGVDYRVKDTGRYMAAGALRVVAVGPGEYLVVERGRLGFWEALARAAAGGVDVVVVEGFREMLREALARGGCGVYIGPRGDVEGLPGGGRLLVVEPGRVGGALERLLELLGSGRCAASLEPRQA